MKTEFYITFISHEGVCNRRYEISHNPNRQLWEYLIGQRLTELHVHRETVDQWLVVATCSYGY